MAKIAQKIEILHGSDNQNFNGKIIFFKVFVFMNECTKNNIF